MTKATVSSNERICSAATCNKLVKFGLACSHCTNHFHPKCAKLAVSEVKQINSSPGSLWFCSGCTSAPLVKCILALSQKYDSLIVENEHRFNAKIAALETVIAGFASQQSPLCSASKPRKRAKRSHDIIIPPVVETPLRPFILSDRSTPEYIAPTPLPTAVKKDVSVTPSVPTNGMKPNLAKCPPTYAAVAAQPIQDKHPVNSCIAAAALVMSQVQAAGTSAITKDKPANPLANMPSTPTMTRRNYGALTLICTNVPESKADSLRGKQLDELRQWYAICDKIGVRATPTNLMRITRHPNSTHYGESRLLRITLGSVTEVEAVLLSSYRLRSDASGVRIFPDVPWSERQRNKTSSNEHNMSIGKRTIFVYGVPEPSAASEEEIRSHDLDEWRYIQEALSVDDITLHSISRLPVSPSYKGNGPRILKLVVQSSQMATSLIHSWQKLRRKLPSELRLKMAEPRAVGSLETTVPSGSPFAPNYEAENHTHVPTATENHFNRLHIPRNCVTENTLLLHSDLNPISAPETHPKNE